MYKATAKKNVTTACHVIRVENKNQTREKKTKAKKSIKLNFLNSFQDTVDFKLIKSKILIQKYLAYKIG